MRLALGRVGIIETVLADCVERWRLSVASVNVRTADQGIRDRLLWPTWIVK